RNIPSVTDLLREGKAPEDLLKEILAGIPFHFLEKKDLSFQCTCSRERIERVLVSLGTGELKSMIAEQGQTDVTCEFCRSRYHFSRDELTNLLMEMAEPANA
ncbi:MAG TPA: Hsp33 family molecular chaperone HslO, partial [Thermodesulfobacteriota bacterium]|nr:Hsp33 family molecular chaperone HslO [Thermodesulfobacteriota bacterium]